MEVSKDEEAEAVSSNSILAEYGILDSAPETSYDDIASLAAQICGTPVAYVSFIQDERQWFKAKRGFDMDENALEKSFCLHTLRQGAMLVIPDLTRDDRTKENTLVSGEPNFRFYAGTLLKTPENVVLGTLCVMDVKSHPMGLSPDQQRAMQALSRQVMELLELRRINRERDLARAQMALSERRYLTIFESAVDYAIIVLDIQGLVTDWNEGATRIFGWTRQEMSGNAIEKFFTVEDRAAGIPQREMIDARSKGRGIDERWHVRKGGQRFWASGEMMPMRENNGNTFGFVKILRDKTMQRETEVHQSALFELADKLKDAKASNDVLDAAVHILQKHLKFDRAGFGRVDPLGKFIDIEDSWCAENLPVLSGVIPFSDLGDAANVIARGEALIAADIVELSRTSDNKAMFAALKLRATIQVPVVEQGKAVSVFIVNSQYRQDWTQPEIDLVRAIAERTRPALARIQAEEHQKILNGELSHRLKNTLAMVRGIAGQTFRGAADPTAFEAFEQRIMALSAAHDILFHNDWVAGRIYPLIRATMALHANNDQLQIGGPDIDLGPAAAVSLSLLLHELATNSIKHGSLSNSAGKVRVEWALSENDDEKILILHWKESGGPAVTVPTKKGFGSRLIESGLAGTRQVNLRYDPDGFSAEFTAPLSAMRAI